MQEKQESSDIRTQTAGQVDDYTTLHLSTRSWEMSKDHVKIWKIIGKRCFRPGYKGLSAARL